MPKKSGQVQKCATFVRPAQVHPILRTGYYVLFSITIAHSNKQIRGQLVRITLGWAAEAQNVTIFENLRFPIKNA